MNLIRTDLAVEAAEPYRDRLPDGVSIAEDERAGVKLTRVEITKPEAAERLGRPCGRYITLELPAVSSSVEPADDVTHAVADELSALLPAEGSVLVVGLGNEQITPDALGPPRRPPGARHPGTSPPSSRSRPAFRGCAPWPPSRPACSDRRASRRARSSVRSCATSRPPASS